MLRTNRDSIPLDSLVLIQGGPQKMQKLNEYPTTKSLNYEFIRAWHIWKTSNIESLTIDVL